MGDACPLCGRKYPADKLRDPDPERQVDIDEFLRYRKADSCDGSGWMETDGYGNKSKTAGFVAICPGCKNCKKPLAPDTD